MNVTSGSIVISNSELAGLSINRVIFHDIPKHIREGGGKPRFSEDTSVIDLVRRNHLLKRLVVALGSSAAYPIAFVQSSTSLVPPEIRSITLRDYNLEEFVAMSQKLGQHLFDLHQGTISPGLLCVIEIASGVRKGIVLMKLEREEGAQLQFANHSGKNAFDMNVLDDLVLTEGTRLFKTGIFIRKGPGAEDFSALACDTQLEEMARFWLRFLGCTYVVQPRIATRRFYEATLGFINGSPFDPVQRNDLYEHLQSEIKLASRVFSPKAFMKKCIPAPLHEQFKRHLSDEKVEMTNFGVDTSEIKSKLRRRAYHTERGATVTVPAEESELVEIRKTNLIVNDKLQSVDEK